ncbi:MAG: glycosyltransferase family 2 protein [Thermoanaerobaculum sp.]|nr:glycosyltransferase family 2 protein [Thermoanaerobaculum sp.]
MAVIIPARDEEASVAQVVREVSHALERAAEPVSFEILVVDDGSRDGTARAAQQAGARVLVLDAPCGYGAAVKWALRQTKAEFVALLDADGSYPAAALPELLVAVRQGADQAVGARVAPGAEVPLLRRPAKWVVKKVAELLLGSRIPDLNSGMRVLRRSRVLALWRLLPDGFSLTTTLTVAGVLDSWVVRWVPIGYHKRIGQSKFRAVRDTWRLLLSLARAVVYFDPLRFFLPVSLGLGVWAVAFGLWDLFWEHNLTDKTVLTSLSALEVFILGLLADLLVKNRTP